jgi:Cft2 family RNA processing exonuclease
MIISESRAKKSRARKETMSRSARRTKMSKSRRRTVRKRHRRRIISDILEEPESSSKRRIIRLFGDEKNTTRITRSQVHVTQGDILKQLEMTIQTPEKASEVE